MPSSDWSCSKNYTIVLGKLVFLSRHHFLVYLVLIDKLCSIVSTVLSQSKTVHVVISRAIETLQKMT